MAGVFSIDPLCRPCACFFSSSFSHSLSWLCQRDRCSMANPGTTDHRRPVQYLDAPPLPPGPRGLRPRTAAAPAWGRRKILFNTAGLGRWRNTFLWSNTNPAPWVFPSADVTGLHASGLQTQPEQAFFPCPKAWAGLWTNMGRKKEQAMTCPQPGKFFSTYTQSQTQFPLWPSTRFSLHQVFENKGKNKVFHRDRPCLLLLPIKNRKDRNNHETQSFGRC